MVYFDSCGLYVASQTSLLSKINACGAIIDKLLITMSTAAEKGLNEEVMLNDGQTIIKTKYRDINQIEAAINGMRRLQNIYIKEYNRSGVIRVMDNINFYPRNF